MEPNNLPHRPTLPHTSPLASSSSANLQRDLGAVERGERLRAREERSKRIKRESDRAVDLSRAYERYVVGGEASKTFGTIEAPEDTFKVTSKRSEIVEPLSIQTFLDLQSQRAVWSIPRVCNNVDTPLLARPSLDGERVLLSGCANSGCCWVPWRSGSVGRSSPLYSLFQPSMAVSPMEVFDSCPLGGALGMYATVEQETVNSSFKHNTDVTPGSVYIYDDRHVEVHHIDIGVQNLMTGTGTILPRLGFLPEHYLLAVALGNMRGRYGAFGTVGMQSVPFLSYIDVGTGRVVRKIYSSDVGARLNSTITLADGGDNGNETRINTSRVQLPEWSGAMAASPSTGLMFMGHSSLSVAGSAYKHSVGAQSLVSLWSPSEEFTGPVMVIDLASAVIGTYTSVDGATGAVTGLDMKTTHYSGMVSHIAVHRNGHNFAVCLTDESSESTHLNPTGTNMKLSDLVSPLAAFDDGNGVVDTLRRKAAPIICRLKGTGPRVSTASDGVINAIVSNASISTKVIQANSLKMGVKVRDRIKVIKHNTSRASSSSCILFDLRMPGRPINRVPLWHEKTSAGNNAMRSSPVVDMDISETGMLAIAYGSNSNMSRTALQSTGGSRPLQYSSAVTSCVEFWPGDIWTSCEGGMLSTGSTANAGKSSNIRPIMCHRTPKATASISGFRFIPHNDNGVVCSSSGVQFIPIPGSGDPTLPSIDNGIGALSNPYASRKVRANALVNSLIEKLPPSTVTLHPEDIGTVASHNSRGYQTEKKKKLSRKSPHESERTETLGRDEIEYDGGGEEPEEDTGRQRGKGRPRKMKGHGRLTHVLAVKQGQRAMGITRKIEKERLSNARGPHQSKGGRGGRGGRGGKGGR